MINNRADLWEEPEKFLPFKRWSNEEVPKQQGPGQLDDTSQLQKGKETEKKSLCWLSFGAGPRNW